MSLPILNVKSEPGPTEFVRYFHKAKRLWTQHMAEEEQLDIGTAFFNAQLVDVDEANRVVDAALPEGTPLADALAEVATFFEQKGSRCRGWVMNPSSPAEQTDPLIEHLLASGYIKRSTDIMHLGQSPAKITEVGGLTIIPARASFKHSATLALEATKPVKSPQRVEAEMSHLNDPHWDALIALREQIPVARIGVLGVGDFGLIEQLFVAEPFRRQGIATTMMSRAIEICARSLFKHVLLGVALDNLAGINLFTKLGFRKIGEFVEYQSIIP